MENREDLPRVSVGTVQDWQKLRIKYREAALESLRAQIVSNKALAREQDAIMAHLEQYFERTFTFAQPNLRVNGNAFESLDGSGRDMEPFDEALDRRIWSLQETRLQWHKRIAETRRTVPSDIEATISHLLEQHRELDTVALRVPEEDMDEPMSEEDAIQHERIEVTMQKTAALSNELDQTMAQQKERGERIRVIATEVDSLKT